MKYQVSGISYQGDTGAVAFLAAVFLFFDQAVKFLFADSEGYYCNPIGPWGVGIGNSVMILVTVVILVSIGYFLWRKDVFGKWEVLAFTMILSGGFSNLIDRIFFACVRDFSPVSLFPAFNLADIFLTIGGTMLVVALFREKTERKRGENDESF